MEEYLNEDRFTDLVIWVASQLNQDLNPVALHAAITAMEDRLFATDQSLQQQKQVMLQLRPAVHRNGRYHLKKMMLHAALRLAMLGLLALYGDRMNTSPALQKLQLSRSFAIDVLWQIALERSPKLNGPDMSLSRAAARQEAAEGCPHPMGTEELVQYLQQSLPFLPEDEDTDPETAGWYVVANWLDLDISVNDKPWPSYDGAVSLGDLRNGTLVYVLEAPGYKGLHVSQNVWGRIRWHDGYAWIPMNLMVRISC